jgi:A/G-specific adenine glycosylase
VYRVAQKLDFFTKVVLQWFTHNGRDFPWRKTANPYNIFVAESLLRRTKANQVVETYLILIERYPTPEALSNVDMNELRQIIQPLGLVKRADLLIGAAKRIVQEHGGMIPNDLHMLSALPGIGIYSSRAILCLSFNAAVPMIDESSGRLLRRVLDLPSNGPAYSDRKLLKIAETIIPVDSARAFNLGMLDIAFAYCHHNIANCPRCPLNGICIYSCL